MAPRPFADELFPLPEHSEHGSTDSLAVAVRRAGAVAIIVFFLMATIFLVVTETVPEVRGHARPLHVFFYRTANYFEVEYKPDR